LRSYAVSPFVIIYASPGETCVSRLDAPIS
jgi:hypothetical protein